MSTRKYEIHEQQFMLSKFESSCTTPDTEQGDIPCKVRVVLRYQNQLHEVIPVRLFVMIMAAVLNLPVVDIDVTWSLHESLGNWLISHKWLRNATKGSCSCAHINDEFKVDGHLMTCRFDWATHWPTTAPILNMLSKVGLSHVPTRELNIDHIIEEYCSLIPYLTAAGWPDKAETLVMVCMVVVQMLCSSSMPEGYVAEDTPLLRESAAVLRNLCVIEASDKAKSHPCFMCKHALLARLNVLFHTPSEWCQVTPDVTALLKDIQLVLPTYAIDTDNPIWAVPHQIFKPHKKSMRTIVGNAHVSLTPLGNMLSDCSKILLAELKAACADLSRLIFEMYGIKIKLDTVVQDSLQAALNLPVIISVLDGLTCDIVACYDKVTIDPDDPDSVISRMKWIVEFIKARYDDMEPCFYVRKKPQREDSCECDQEYLVKFAYDGKVPNGFSKVSLEDYVWLLTILLCYSYVQFGGKVWRKGVGVQQGTQPAPFVINMHFISYETEYVLKSVFDEEQLKSISELFANYNRLIDDLCILGTSDALEKTKKIYPAYVEMDNTWKNKNGEGGVVGEGPFLNMNVQIRTDGSVVKKAIFKEDKLPFSPVQYVQANANRSRLFGRNVILSQMIVVVLLNDRFQDAVSHFRKLLHIFMQNGFDRTEISRAVVRYLKLTDFSQLRPNYEPVKAWYAAERQVP
jgi:hypothetical protein